MKTEIYKDMKLFYEKSKYVGFAGRVKIFDKELFIDTRDGTGYDNALSELDAYVYSLTKKYSFDNLCFSKDDMKQHIIMRILESIPMYDPKKEAALSSFLYVRVERLIINELISMGAALHNPTVLKTSLCKVTCKCGENNIFSTDETNNIQDMSCDRCGGSFEDARVYSINTSPKQLEGSVNHKDEDRYSQNLTVDEVLSNKGTYMPMIFGNIPDIDELAISKCDFDRWMETEDEKTKQLVDLVYKQDYSIIKAAKMVGISHMGAYNVLKKLKRRKIVREIFNRE